MLAGFSLGYLRCKGMKAAGLQSFGCGLRPVAYFEQDEAPGDSRASALHVFGSVYVCVGHRPGAVESQFVMGSKQCPCLLHSAPSAPRTRECWTQHQRGGAYAGKMQT